MILGEIFEQVVSVEKTVWRKRGDKITRKDVSRVVATDVEPRPRKTIKVTDGSE
jgi:hypothetical protein